MNKVIFKQLWGHIPYKRKKQLVFLFFLMVLSLFAEMVSIGAIVPFISVIIDPDTVFQHPLAQPFISFFEINARDEFILSLTIGFIVTIFIAGLIRLALLYTTLRFSQLTGTDLSIDIYRRTLYQDYSIHMTSSSSEVINSVTNKTDIIISGVITPILMLTSSIFIFFGVIYVLLSINTLVALITFTGLGLAYLGVFYFTKSKVNSNSESLAKKSTQRIKALQEGLGGIRDVLIDGSQQFYCDIYHRADFATRIAKASNSFIGMSPRYVIEVVAISLIATLAYSMSIAQQQDDLLVIMPTLSAIALGTQRLLPAAQQIYSSISTVKASYYSFEDAMKLLNRPISNYISDPKIKYISFKKHICLNDVSFRYSENTPIVVNNLNLKILKGNCIGFIGKTGSGKSTLLDIIMGLLSPSEGQLIIDNQTITVENRRAWQMHIAHVPQNIFLSDSTVEENIAFGLSSSDIDQKLVRQVARLAQISDFIESWPKQYQTIVGENGILISGGQRQRIGIARALYKQADILILDEATSALDNDTERKVMESINKFSGNLTILIIAHRLSTLKNCNKIVELENNRILRTGTYKELVSST